MFLNKYDLLEAKLASGVKVNKYLPSFGERENSAPVLARCTSRVRTPAPAWDASLWLLPATGRDVLTCPCDRLDLHQKFRDQHREYSPQTGRPFYGYVTTAVVRLSSLIAFSLLDPVHVFAGHGGDRIHSSIR